MVKKGFITVAALFLFFVQSIPVFAASVIVVTPADLSFSKEDPLVGETIRIYATLANRGDDDARGIVKFYDGTSKQIGSDQPFTIRQGKNTDVFTDYDNLPYGDRKIVVKIFPWPSQTAIISATVNLFVDRDSDKDGTPDRKDPDDDNDGVEDEKDAFPLDPSESADTDKDGIGDNKDNDDDGDSLSDTDESAQGTDPKKADTDGDAAVDGQDVFPLDPNESEDTDRDGTGNNADSDDDNDTVPDSNDVFPEDKTESVDYDSDKVGDNRDLDDDDDGLTDGKEADLKTDPKKADTDGDGTVDGKDAFPLDASESLDTDKDGLGDKQDPNNKNKGPVLKYDIPESPWLFIPLYFDARATSDPDGKIVKIVWNLDGQIIEHATFWYLFFLPGDHTLILSAVDDAGESRLKKMTISISAIVYAYLLLIAALIWLSRALLRRLQKPKFRRQPVKNSKSKIKR